MFSQRFFFVFLTISFKIITLAYSERFVWLHLFGFMKLQIMVTNVTSLLKTVKSVEDEHTRGTRALEATIEAIAQEVRVSVNEKYYQANSWNCSWFK